MKIFGAKKLSKQLGRLPVKVRKHVTDAIYKSTEEGARVARTLAPDVTGRTKASITTEYQDEGMTGIVVSIRSDDPRKEKDRAYSIEYGRKKGKKGVTAGSHHIFRTKHYLSKRMKNRIKRAINKAAKETFSG